MKAVTVRDVSRESGSAYSTAAQILQGKRNYRKETVARVLRAAEKLGYTPNYLSKSLRSGKSMTIGLYLETTVTAPSKEIFYPLEVLAREHDYALSVSSGTARERIIKQLKSFMSHRIDGLIYHNTNPKNDELADFLRGIDIPMVFIDRAIPESYPANIRIDYTQAFDDMAAYIHSCGHKEALLLEDTFFQKNKERLRYPYKRALERYGVKLVTSKKWSYHCQPDYEQTAYNHVMKNLKDGSAPKLLLCFNDQAAIGAIAAIKDFGLSVPDDISVVGRDGLVISDFIRPALTTIVRPSGNDIANAAFQMLYKMLNDSSFTPQPVYLSALCKPGDTVLKN